MDETSRGASGYAPERSGEPDDPRAGVLHPASHVPAPRARAGRPRATTVWGVALLVAALLLLLDRLGVAGDGALLWGTVLAVGALVCARVVRSGPGGWWAAIPGGALLGLAAAVVLDELPATAGTDVGGTAFLALTGAGFWVVRARSAERWWATVPAGVLTTLALVTLASENGGDDVGAAVLFFGLAATFALVAVLPGPHGRPRWPLVPAAALTAVGVVVAFDAVADPELLGFVWPALLAVAGLVLLWSSVRRGARERRGR